VRKNIMKLSFLPGILLALAIFGLEIATPHGVAEATLYVLVVLISLRTADRRFILGMLSLCTFLTVAGFFVSAGHVELWTSVANRSFAIIAFWVVGLVGLQHVQMEASLRESKLHYQDVLDHMLEGAQIIGFDWRYLYVNDSLVRHARLGREELLGHTMLDAYPGIENTPLFEVLHRCMEERIPHLMENEFVFPDGESRWFELSIQPVQEGLFILSNDVTTHKRSEEDLRLLNQELERRVAQSTSELRLMNEQLASELFQREQLADNLMIERDLLQTLMDNIPDMIYFKDTASRFTRINRAQAKLLRVSRPEEAIGKTDLDFQTSEFAQSFYEEEQHILQSGESLTNRVEFNPTPEGKPRWFSATKVPIKDEKGNITGIVGVSRDITMNKQAEEALRTSEERFRLVSWATKDAVWDWDLKTNQVEWGAGLQKIFHYPPEITHTDSNWWLEHIHPEDRDRVSRSMNQALQNSLEFWSKEYRFQRADETYASIMDRGYIIQNGTGKPSRVIGAMLDITERRQAEETIRHQNEMLSSLHNITLNLLRHREISQLLNALVEFSTAFLDAPYAEIMLAVGDKLVIKAVTQNQQSLIGQRLGRQAAVLSWQAFDTHEPAVLSDYANWPQRQVVYNEFSLHAVADFPILNDDQCLGVLALGRDKAGYEFTTDQIQFGRFFANLTALVLNNAQLREALQEQSIRDPLTGLFNRRYMEETLRREVQRVTRQLHPLGIIMIDIDHFKHFNDTHGHTVGDMLLQNLGQFLQSHVRGEDVACRYGGEEFILILPNTSLETARERAEHLRQEAKRLQVQDNSHAPQGITLSLGIAIYPEHGRTMQAALRAADAALYRAKQEGRDRVVVADEAK
jgi:diguanylate cyclase (GGDEF)-like protein/PAS domain S-box-containing protein